MKKIILVLAAFFVIVAVNAKKRTHSIVTDTVNGAETIYFQTNEITQGVDVLFQSLCTNIGGTSDGLISLEGSGDGTSWEVLKTTTGFINSYPSDSLTIVDAAVVQHWVVNCPWSYLRHKVTGTASDSTLITSKYTLVE